MQSADVKRFYETYSDEIVAKRLESPFPLRRHAHRQGYRTIQSYVRPGMTVLDAGCGEGVLAWYLAEAGAIVTAMDISRPNLENASKFLAERGVADRVTLVHGDAESLPFPDASFDLVVSSHVLEHLPDFDRGLAEIRRVTRSHAVVALPTCLNLAAASQLGGASFWRPSKAAPLGLLRGLWRIVANLRNEGVQEGYAGTDELPHVWRYPWVMKRRLEGAGFEIVRFEAATLVVPYFSALLPLVEILERFKASPVLQDLGYGSVAYVRKRA
ncbi:MAG TPA: class I SAM-dependent methyltransferase [Acidimicrobiia bacterium]|jgi:SAM-dependent methyltransferase|nr:class I SAM-dependent methyltransferase [Acidimicrobiia bacterium]